MDDLASQLDALRAEKPELGLGQCRAVRINSGKFGVPWSRTKEVLEEGTLDMVVVRPGADEVAKEGDKRIWKGLRKGDVGGTVVKVGKVGEVVEVDGLKASRIPGDLAEDLGENKPRKRRRTREP